MQERGQGQPPQRERRWPFGLGRKREQQPHAPRPAVPVTSIPPTPAEYISPQRASETSQNLRSAVIDRDVELGAGGSTDSFLIHEEFGGKSDQALYVVSAGHGLQGAKAESYGEMHMAEIFGHELEIAPDAPSIALEKTFFHLHEVLKNQLDGYSGMSAAALFFRGNMVYLAHVGEIRITHTKDGVSYQFSKTHDASNSTEVARIRQAGGDVQADGSIKDTGISVYRGLGYGNVDDIIIPEPVVESFRLSETPSRITVISPQDPRDNTYSQIQDIPQYETMDARIASKQALDKTRGRVAMVLDLQAPQAQVVGRSPAAPRSLADKVEFAPREAANSYIEGRKKSWKKKVALGTTAAALAVCIPTAIVVNQFRQGQESEPQKPSWIINPGEKVSVPAGLDCETLPGTIINDEAVPQPEGVAVIARFKQAGDIFSEQELTCYESSDENAQELAQEDIAPRRENIKEINIREYPVDR